MGLVAVARQRKILTDRSPGSGAPARHRVLHPRPVSHDYTGPLPAAPKQRAGVKPTRADRNGPTRIAGVCAEAVLAARPDKRRKEHRRPAAKVGRSPARRTRTTTSSGSPSTACATRSGFRPPSRTPSATGTPSWPSSPAGRRRRAARAGAGQMEGCWVDGCPAEGSKACRRRGCCQGHRVVLCRDPRRVSDRGNRQSGRVPFTVGPADPAHSVGREADPRLPRNVSVPRIRSPRATARTRGRRADLVGTVKTTAPLCVK